MFIPVLYVKVMTIIIDGNSNVRNEKETNIIPASILIRQHTVKR